jgi:hypothetical protein
MVENSSHAVLNLIGVNQRVVETSKATVSRVKSQLFKIFNTVITKIYKEKTHCVATVG